MKLETYQVTMGDGTKVEGKIAVPETLEELKKVYPEPRIYQLGLAEYMRKAKKRLVSKRSPRLVYRLADLTLEQQEVLRKIGLLKRG